MSIKSLLGHPAAFRLFNRGLGGPAVREWLMTRWVCPQPGERLLDLGCGTGEVLATLPADVEYVGVDLSSAYIAAAKRRWGRRGTFLCGDVSSIDLNAGRFDRALAIALLHHLNDAAASALTQLVRRHVRLGGSFVTIDADGGSDVSWLARRIIHQDRGRDIRTADGYRAILSACGPVEIERRTDLLRIPYAHVIARVTIKMMSGARD